MLSGWLASQRERAPQRRPLEQLDGWLRLRGADRLPGARRRRSGARGVLELLLRAEQGVQHLLAQAFAEREREAPADDRHHEEASTTLAAAALLATAQGIGRVLEGGGRFLELLLGLLVLRHGLDRALAVGHPRVCLARGVVSGTEIVAQLVVLDDPLHVLVGADCLARRDRSGSRLRGLLLRCHRLSSTSAGSEPNHTRLPALSTSFLTDANAGARPPGPARAAAGACGRRPCRPGARPARGRARAPPPAPRPRGPRG